MALETGNYVSDLIGSNPVGTDDSALGDNHLRLIKSVLKGTFPNASRPFYFESVLSTKTAAYTIASTDARSLVPCDTTAAGFTVTLPTAATAGAGFVVWVVKLAVANLLTITASGAETINGAATVGLSGQYHSASFICDGSRWYAMPVGDTPYSSAEQAKLAALDGALYAAKAANLSDLGNAATARGNLGLAIGSDVQSWGAALDNLIAAGVSSANAVGVSQLGGTNTGDEVVATETVAGIIKKATTAEAQGGVTADVYPDSVGVAAAITALASGVVRPKLVETRTIVGGEAALDFTGYGAYSKIQIFFKQVSASASVNWQMLLSSDNGATWLSAGYSSSVSDPAGSATEVVTQFKIQDTRSWGVNGICELLEFNAATETFQWAIMQGREYSSGYGPVGANDAFRLTLNTADTFSSGTIYVYGVK